MLRIKIAKIIIKIVVDDFSVGRVIMISAQQMVLMLHSHHMGQNESTEWEALLCLRLVSVRMIGQLSVD